MPALRPVRTVPCAVICLLLAASAVNAEAPGVKTLTGVDFASHADRFEFALRADGPIDPDAISARAEGPVLMIRLDAARADRRWLDTPDPAIRRTLLHPSRRGAPAAIVRTRLAAKVAPVTLENIRVRADGDRVVIAVPRDAAVARRWADSPAPAAEAPAGAVQLTFAPPAEAAPGDATADAIADATDATDADAIDDPMADAIAAVPGGIARPDAPDAPDAIAEPPAAPAIGEDAPLLAAAPAAGEADVPLSAGLASVEGPGVGAFLMSLLFLGAVGLLMWRKMRGSRDTATGRPLIRPIGSHMLGPKQSLLLVDVAGEMVLLGTTDKGVQMLTKIEGRDDGRAAPEVSPGPEVPREAFGAGTFADRLGAAVTRFRSAAARLETPADAPEDRAAERRFFAREREAVREAAEEDALAALADRVEDQPRIEPRRRARRDFAPVEPAPAAPPAPTADDGADLLRRLRALHQA